ncbi:hypothetical protein K8354_07930 [Polaribacter litorisediminis]|uniref:hypothetical protein n=1 Tax=Polaribacter litorisediminis TaxID=1908341 RepID=UPI001CBFE2FC|nr:hypothetical protein [Polaribacter litorisediminis]UAM99723.1 hypothetical protein K8354_07930 [Polaribacter litorisediminis]
MKKIKFILAIVFAMQLNAQEQIKLNDFGRIILNTYLPENTEIPKGAKKALETKLSQITTNNGMGASAASARFIITAVLNIGTKDVVPGPPQMIAQNIDVTFFIGDAVTNTIFSNTIVSVKGVGTNENKALINAIKNIKPKNNEIISFLEKGKIKILNYYTTQCDFIIKDAETLAKQEKYDEAIYKLALVPEVCKECYFKTSELIDNLFQQKINTDCDAKLSKAKLLWSGQQNIKQAEELLKIITDINPNASCYYEVVTFTKEISLKINQIENDKLKLALKVYQDNIDLDKKKIDAYRDIALEHAKNNPKTINYNNINWR